MNGLEGPHERRRALEEAFPDIPCGSTCWGADLPPWPRHRLFRPGEARRLEAGRRDHRHRRSHRCRLRATPPEAQLGTTRFVKRFWKTAEAVATARGFAIALDGRRVKTPAKAELILPTEQLADAVAAEWNRVGETIDPREMPLTGFANAAIDRIGPAKEEFAEGVARYGESDLTCYRAEGPDALVRWQLEAWDAILEWARRRYDVDFAICSGV